ncbi:MAG: DUF2065 domain-containing protein [Hyphomicrobiaceae bacterium]|nr:DUF2065 domain-containing protein [Hyphomicrobiaceae bacterium]
MNDLIVGLGLALVIEGLLWAAFPDLALRIVRTLARSPETQLRLTGALTMTAGVSIVWLIRG